MNLQPTHKYDDIITLPHHQSPRRAGMPMTDRAAQFSPFAALTGYEDVIEETGRLTQPAAELTDSSIQQLDEKLQILAQNSHLSPAVTVVYFQPDLQKAGGSYLTATGYVKRIDPCSQVLRLTDGRQIPLAAIVNLTIARKMAGEGQEFSPNA